MKESLVSLPVNPFEGEPTISSESDETLGEYVTYSFKIVDGANCILYATKEDDDVFQIFAITSPSKLSTEDAKTWGSFLAIVVAGFESDPATLAQIDEKLNIPYADQTVDQINSANGTNAYYSYIISKGTIMLSITPKL